MKRFFSAFMVLTMLFAVSACDTSTPEGNAYVTHVISEGLAVTPISHATAVLQWDGMTIYSDPTGGEEAFQNQPLANIIFVTDIHGDHLDVETLDAVLTEDTVLVVPPAVDAELPSEFAGTRVVMENGDSADILGFTFEAIPMYDLPVSDDSRHVKGRGNGYVIEKDQKRIYFSGDTADIPEMRDLQDIDVAFICMNLPYTMDVDAAADAVLEFQPLTVFPYHYRGKDGFSDVNRFKELVNTGVPGIDVILLDWYPGTD